jgi:hypothetical protein
MPSSVLRGLAALLTIGVVGAAAPAAPRARARDAGTLADLPRYVRSALAAPQGRSILVVNVASPDDFVQFSLEAGRVAFSFPLLTPGQKAGEAKLRAALADLALRVNDSRGSDGSAFLDVTVSADAPGVTRITRTLLTRVHGVTDKTALDYECQGCGAAR